jgi:phosphonate transport system substrate-binding protein
MRTSLSVAHFAFSLISSFALFLLTTAGLFISESVADERGREETELVLVFQKQQSPAEMQARADAFATLLTEKVGRKVKAVVPGDYAASVQALVSGTADLAYLDSTSFLMAQRDGDASIVLAELRPDAQGRERTDYDSVLVAHKDSQIDGIDQLIAEADNLSIAFTSRSSTSGYLFPYRAFVQKGLLKAGQRVEEVFKQVQYGGSYRLALSAVLDGRSDVAAVSAYTIEGPASSQYLSDEEREQLRVIARLPGVPTHVLAARAGLSEDLKNQLKQSLLQLTTDNAVLLKDVYGAARFVEVDSKKHVAPTAEALLLSGSLTAEQDSAATISRVRQ